jgi:hypothetical protein
MNKNLGEPGFKLEPRILSGQASEQVKRTLGAPNKTILVHFCEHDDVRNDVRNESSQKLRSQSVWGC